MGLTDLFDNLAAVSKLTIISYKDGTFKKTSGDQFTVMYNPNTYSRSYRTVWANDTPEGSQADSQKYQRQNSDVISLEFLLDGTGVSTSGDTSLLTLGASNSTDAEFVDKQIELFFKVTKTTDGDTHMPNFIQVSWGSLNLFGVMESAEVTYKLFHSSGLPLRATINATFKQSISDEEAAALLGLKSPDLTHLRLVQEGETLPLIAEKVYGNPALYLEIARVNNINNFRKLTVGQQLVLPPINKKENG